MATKNLIVKKIGYYIFGISVWVLFIQAFCDPTPCETPIATTIGVNDSFSITPLKDSYNSGEKIIIKFTIDSKARLYDDKEVIFDLFKKTEENEALLLGEHSGNFSNLYTVPNDITTINPSKIITGKNHEHGGNIFLYQPETNSYVLELEITLLSKGSYIIDGFKLELNLGKREVYNCHFYVHLSTMKFDPPISFEVK